VKGILDEERSGKLILYTMDTRGQLEAVGVNDSCDEGE